nr:hypothetical protein [Tanacetum cinerariifolium]
YNVVAPYAGVVDNVLPKLGETVAPGAPIVQLNSGQGGKVLADVSEAYAGSIKAGDKALVTLPDMGSDEIPSTVRTHDEENAYVLVANKEGGKVVATKRVIKTGQTYNGKQEVLSGLKSGDEVISAGYQNLNAGQTVKVG